MPAPTFSLPISGIAPDEMTTREGLEAAVQAGFDELHENTEAKTTPAALALMAPLASPALTGTPTAPTPAPATDSTRIATTAFVQAVVLVLMDGVPVYLDTMSKLATAINNDPNFATTINNAIAAKAALANPAFTGVPTAPTPAPATNNGQIATTAFVHALLLTLVENSPAALDTFNELAAALGDDPNFATTIFSALATKAAISHGHEIGDTAGLPEALDGKATTAQGGKADTALQDDGSGYDRPELLMFTDLNGRGLGSIGADGSWDITLREMADADMKIAEFAREGGAGFEFVDQQNRVLEWEFDLRVTPFGREYADDLIFLLDAGGGLLREFKTGVSDSELIEARASAPDLNSRLSKQLDDRGLSLSEMWEAPRLRRLRMALAQLDLNASAQINIAAVGDSYTQNPNRWTGHVASKLIELYGDGGGAWTGYVYYGAYTVPYVSGVNQPVGVNGNVRPAQYALAYDGAWDRVHNGGPGPDLGYVFTSTVTDKITRTVPAAPDHTSLRLIYINTVDGELRHRVDGGAWTNITTQGALDSIGTTDIALTAGAHSVEIEVVAGTVKLCGDDARSDADGVRFHKLGASGSRIEQWVSQDATQQQASWAVLEVDTFLLMDGTNSQGHDVTPEDWAGQVDTLVGRMRSAVATPDIAIIMPPENLRTDNTYPMADYQSQGRDRADVLRAGFLNLQSGFGDSPTDYASDGDLPLFNADDVHPSTATGGYIMAAAIINFMKPY